MASIPHYVVLCNLLFFPIDTVACLNLISVLSSYLTNRILTDVCLMKS